MSDKRWYRDARFIIPTLLVPFAIAFLPGLFRPGQADRLLVSVSLTDPRRDDAGPRDRQAEVALPAGDLTRLGLANLVADTVLTLIGLPEIATESDGSTLAVLLERGPDGILFVTGPGSDSVALHFSRFIGLTDLTDLVESPSPVQRQLVEPAIGGGDVSVAELALRAGVYRVVLTAPGYRDVSLFLQLTDVGEVLTLFNGSAPTPALFPIGLALTPVVSRPRIVAVPDCDETSNTEDRIPYAAIGSELRVALQDRLGAAGYRPVELRQGQRAAFDLNLSKGLPPADGVVFADYAVAWSCEWSH